MDLEERENLIALYRGGYAAVAEALLRITPEEMDARPSPGHWSVRALIHHLADAEMIAAVRLRLMLTEDRPRFPAVDQEAFVQRLHYDRPYEVSLELFQLVRQSTAELLDCLTPADWVREAVHSELGVYSVERWLRIYAEHAHKHARQIMEARAAASQAER